jgi:hypothetical protein
MDGLVKTQIPMPKQFPKLQNSNSHAFALELGFWSFPGIWWLGFESFLENGA